MCFYLSSILTTKKKLFKNVKSIHSKTKAKSNTSINQYIESNM